MNANEDECLRRIQPEEFRVPADVPTSLADRATDSVPGFLDKSTARRTLKQLRMASSELQYQMYAENRQSLLVVFQAMDAGGKDGTIRKVMTGFNPQGCKVHSFKKPTERELEHDFLWRIHPACPPRGEISVFNRSHYEDVLVVRVHQLVEESIWRERYEIINQFESMLSQQGTQILKFFLHISPEEQLRRFEKRLDNPNKRWKISESDYSERPFWRDYESAFEEVFDRCSTPTAPWYIVPADTKWYRDLIVAGIIHDKLKSMKFNVPEPTVDLERIRHLFHQASQGIDSHTP